MARREATQTQTQLGGVGGDAVQGGEANNNALTEEPIPVDLNITLATGHISKLIDGATFSAICCKYIVLLSWID